MRILILDPLVRGPTGYSGLGKYTDGLGQEINNAETIRRTLLWQRDVEGEGAKTSTFKAEVGSLLGFQAFLMMREGTAMVTIMHSVAKYFSISSATSRYQGLVHKLRGRQAADWGARTSPPPSKQGLGLGQEIG
jgi:hypothetical protein